MSYLFLNTSNLEHRISNIYLSLFFLLMAFATSAQTKLFSVSSEKINLQDCIEYAWKNNLNVKQAGLQIQQAGNELQQSRWNILPSLNGGINQGLNLGRTFDLFSSSGTVASNTITNNMGLQAGVTIFNGYQLKNTIVLNQLNLDAAKLDVEALKNQVALNVATAYLGVLSQEDLLEVAQKQIEVTKIQIERTEKLIAAGTLPEVNRYDLEAQLANDELQLVNTQNAIESAKLTLKQIMNMAADRNIDVVRLLIPNPSDVAYPQTSAQIYEMAQSYLPNIKAADMRIKVAEKGIDLAKALKYPIVSANGNFTSYFSTAAKKAVLGTPVEQTIASVTYAGITVPVTTTVPTRTFENISYFNQLSQNRQGGFSLGVQVPIFNRYLLKTRVANAQIQQERSSIQAENERVTLRQSIDQAYISMLNSAKRYSAIQNQVRALEQAFRVAEARLNAGSINTLDFNISKTNLDRAKANLVQAKYDYVFRIKILDFYQNKPL